jgi:hypothetical protein
LAADQTEAIAAALRIAIARAVVLAASHEPATAAPLTDPVVKSRDLLRVQVNDAIAAPADAIVRARALEATQDEPSESKLNEPSAAARTLASSHAKLTEATLRAARARALAFALVQV